MCHIWQCPYTKLSCGGLNVKVSILKIGPLKIRLNIRNDRIIASDFIKETLYKKLYKNVYSDLELNQITDNRLFWKTIKPFLSDKSIQSSTITLVNKHK